MRCPQPYVEDDYGQARKCLWMWQSHSANPSSLNSCSKVPTACGDRLDLTFRLVLPSSVGSYTHTTISVS